MFDLVLDTPLTEYCFNYDKCFAVIFNDLVNLDI